MVNFCDLNASELKAWLKEQDEREFHANQIIEWVYKKGVLEWDKMSNLSKELRQKMAQFLRFPILQLVRVLPSSDKETYKFLWRLPDGNLIESVLILSGDRRTVCVSSQV